MIIREFGVCVSAASLNILYRGFVSRSDGDVGQSRADAKVRVAV